CLGTLLHDVAQLPSEHEAASARDTTGLDEENVTANRGPCQTRRHPRQRGALCDLALKASRTQDCFDRIFIDHDFLDRSLGNLHRSAPEDRTDLPFEITHPGLTRVLANDLH